MVMDINLKWNEEKKKKHALIYANISVCKISIISCFLIYLGKLKATDINSGLQIPLFCTSSYNLRAEIIMFLDTHLKLK